MMNEIELYEALLGFFLTLLITMIKNQAMNKQSAYDALFIGAAGWASHFAVRKILKRKYSNKK